MVLFNYMGIKIAGFSNRLGVNNKKSFIRIYDSEYIVYELE